MRLIRPLSRLGRHRDRWFLGLAIGVAVVLVIGVLVLTSDTGDHQRLAIPTGPPVFAPPTAFSSAVSSSSTTLIEPAASTAGPRSDPSTPTTEPTSTTQPAAGWTSLTNNGAQLEGALEDVIAFGDIGFIAVGSDGTVPLVLASDDGSTWSRVGATSPGFGDAPGLLRDAVVERSSLVVVGRGGDGPAVWETTDFTTWRRVAVDGAASGGVVLAAAAVLGDHLALVGYDRDGAGFWWRDGAAGTLTRAARADVGVLAQGQQILYDVAAVDGHFAAVGTSGGSPALWTSEDGRSWSVRRLENGSTDATPTAIASDGRAVAGYDGVGGVVWRLSNAGGQDVWTRVAVPPPEAAPQTADALAEDENMLRVVGRESHAARCWEASPAGALASCAAPGLDLASSSVRSIASSGRRWVVVGARAVGTKTVTAIWTLNED